MLHGYDIKITDDDLNDSDKEDQGEFGNWLDDAFALITDVFIGVEREVYKAAEKNQKVKDKFKETEGMLVGMKFIEFYLNQVYRQLVEKLDPFIVETFVKMGQKTDEKPLFVLNLIANIINKVYPMMPRTRLDQTDEFKHIDSVRDNLQLMKKYILNDLDDNLKKLKEAKKKKKAEEEDDDK
jgi:hypothetical protein